MAKQLVIDRLLDAAAKYGTRPMLAPAGSAQSYDQIWSNALKLASVLIEESGEEKLIGFLAERDPSAYLAILSILPRAKATCLSIPYCRTRGSHGSCGKLSSRQ